MATHPIIDQALAQGRSLLTEIESKQVLQDAGIATAAAQLSTTEEEAVQAASTIGFPVALKVSSRDIVHKSDIGGVQLNLHTPDEVREAFRTIGQNVAEKEPGATMEGVAVQPMAQVGAEVIIGMSKDATFGPMLMFGLGGVLVEVLKDVTFRIVPLSKYDAQEMIRDIKGFPLLAGYRGAPPADLGALESMLHTLSEFVANNPRVQEVDLNPVYAYADGALAVDARIILEDTSELA